MDDKAARLAERAGRRARYVRVFALLALALAALTVLNVNIGSVSIPIGEIWRIVTGRAAESTRSQSRKAKA